MTMARRLLTLLGAYAACITANAELQLGTGMFDATGVIEGVVMMGMANAAQKGEGLHQRLFSRAFVALDDVSGACA